MMSKIVASFKNLLEAELADSHGKVTLILYVYINGAADPDVELDPAIYFDAGPGPAFLWLFYRSATHRILIRRYTLMRIPIRL